MIQSSDGYYINIANVNYIKISDKPLGQKELKESLWRNYTVHFTNGDIIDATLNLSDLSEYLTKFK